MATIASWYHDGELAVQRRAAVRADAARLEGMLAPPHLEGGLARFLSDRTFAALTSRDEAGILWVSPLTGPPGFLEVADDTTLHVRATPPPGDPLHGLASGAQVGLLVIEFARRRRVRINGTIGVASPQGLTVQVEQAYGNCPQYIQQRILESAPLAAARAVRRAASLTAPEADLIRRADTFILGTTHPERGNDASHRGGPPGFVRVSDDTTLWWPDYPGNNMFNSLGNLALDPTAALLFLDFHTGAALHLSGTARLEWDAPDAGDDAGTGRRVRFTIDRVVAGTTLGLCADGVTPYLRNPPVTD
ncbi:pyridoxamine 5'-phosphate oxidase [Rhodococcus sp. IEGM 248]|nr:pyridoxamine 5'-phosphate oxidase [Rhodococcus sp. IEGM 248]RZL78098.1 MAG: pyridoxamine 5'-phosphate oxidase [Rhodococcus sp. (in: high G+C Gram-positive bacteria)]